MRRSEPGHHALGTTKDTKDTKKNPLQELEDILERAERLLGRVAEFLVRRHYAS